MWNNSDIKLNPNHAAGLQGLCSVSEWTAETSVGQWSIQDDRRWEEKCTAETETMFRKYWAGFSSFNGSDYEKLIIIMEGEVLIVQSGVLKPEQLDK